MKMLFNIMAVILFLSSYQGNITAQTKIEGNIVSNMIAVGKNKLVLNGGGVRTKYFMDMYIGTLYLLKKSSDAKQIVRADEPMCIRIKIVSSLITSSKMEEAVNEGFKKSTNNNIAPIKDKIQQFANAFKEEIKAGDEFEIAYIPDEGLIISKNGLQKGIVKGLDFKQATFGIWLGNDPSDINMKEGMLGN